MSHSLARVIVCTWAGILPGAASAADETARISYLESQIQQLRTQIDEQNRKIERLEEQLRRIAGRSGVDEPPQRPPATVAIERPAQSGAQAWHDPGIWARVGKGMTQAEVTQILGDPTAVESVDRFKTLFYRGVSARGANLSGIVNLRDDRVVAVVPPDA